MPWWTNRMKTTLTISFPIVVTSCTDTVNICNRPDSFRPTYHFRFRPIRTSDLRALQVRWRILRQLQRLLLWQPQVFPVNPIILTMHHISDRWPAKSTTQASTAVRTTAATMVTYKTVPSMQSPPGPIDTSIQCRQPIFPKATVGLQVLLPFQFSPPMTTIRPQSTYFPTTNHHCTCRQTWSAPAALLRPLPPFCTRFPVSCSSMPRSFLPHWIKPHSSNNSTSRPPHPIHLKCYFVIRSPATDYVTNWIPMCPTATAVRLEVVFRLHSHSMGAQTSNQFPMVWIINCWRPVFPFHPTFTCAVFLNRRTCTTTNGITPTTNPRPHTYDQKQVWHLFWFRLSFGHNLHAFLFPFSFHSRPPPLPTHHLFVANVFF